MRCKNCGCDPALETVTFGSGYHTVTHLANGCIEIVDWASAAHIKKDSSLILDKEDARILARFITQECGG